MLNYTLLLKLATENNRKFKNRIKNFISRHPVGVAMTQLAIPIALALGLRHGFKKALAKSELKLYNEFMTKIERAHENVLDDVRMLLRDRERTGKINL